MITDRNPGFFANAFENQRSRSHIQTAYSMMLPWRALDVLTVLSSFRWSPRNSRLTRSCDHCFMLVRLELISSLDWKIHQLILRSTRPSTSWTSQRCHSETDIFQKKIESSVFGLVWVVTRFSFVIPLYCTPELYYWELDFHSLSIIKALAVLQHFYSFGPIRRL